MSGKPFYIGCWSKADPLGSRTRYRVSAVLRHHLEALRLPQHEPSNAEDKSLHVWHSRSTFGELHLHLPRPQSLHSDAARLQAYVYSRHCRKSLFFKGAAFQADASRI